MQDMPSLWRETDARERHETIPMAQAGHPYHCNLLLQSSLLSRTVVPVVEVPMVNISTAYLDVRLITFSPSLSTLGRFSSELSKGPVFGSLVCIFFF